VWWSKVEVVGREQISCGAAPCKVRRCSQKALT
jgi:hypothetical protein